MKDFLAISYESFTMAEENFWIIDLKNAPEWNDLDQFYMNASPWLKNIFESLSIMKEMILINSIYLRSKI